MSDLIGVDRQGGKGYQEVPCEVCGDPLFITYLEILSDFRFRYRQS